MDAIGQILLEKYRRTTHLWKVYYRMARENKPLYINPDTMSQDDQGEARNGFEQGKEDMRNSTAGSL